MKKLFNKRKNKSINKNIDKSLKIIKLEKEKIRDEKKKIKFEKEKKFYSSKLGVFLKDLFDISDNEKEISKTIIKKISCSFVNILFGMVLCLIILFILSGGKNYLKLYSELSDFIDIYDTISSEYFGDFDNEEVVNAAIDSMVDSVGDVYTTYTSREETDSFLEDLEGTYEGIGCMVSMNENSEIYVVEVFEDSPAKEAGIKENDIILEIDGTDYSNKTSEDMANYVKNSSSEELKFVIKREEDKVDVTIVRDKVEVPAVVGEMLEVEDINIGYIGIDVFSSVADEQFKKNLKKLESKDIKGLIIDVRNNTGGYLDVVTDISSLFLKEGKIIYQLETEDKKEKIKDETKSTRKYPVVVLTNGNSASASEILAASIKESYLEGYVVGTNTFGKGTVQKTKKLKNGNMIKYTIQKWLTPKGEYIDKNGVVPTDVIEFEPKGFKDDSQLDYAVNLLKEKLVKE